MMNWGNWGGYGWGMGFGWIFMILFWVLVIVALCISSRQYRGGPSSQGRKRRHSTF